MRKLLEDCGCASPPPPPTPAQPMPCPPPPPPPIYHAPPTPPYSNSPPPKMSPNHYSPPPAPQQQEGTPPSQPNTPPGQPPSQTFTRPPSQPVTPPSQPIGPPLSPPTPNYYSPPNLPGGPPYSPFTVTPYTSNTPPPESTHHHRALIITACSVGGFFFLAFLLAALLCCKKRYRMHDEECETVETAEALGTAEVVGSSVPVNGADGQIQKEGNKGKKKVNNHVKACIPHHKLMASEFNRDDTPKAPPPELSEYAQGVFEEFGPKFLRDQLQEQPLEPTAAGLVRDLLACGTSAAHLLSKIKDVEAIQSGEAPPELLKILQNEKKTLHSEKAPLEEEEEEEKKLKENKKQHNKQMSEMVKHDALVDLEGRVLESGSILPNLTNLALKNPWRGDWPLFDEKVASPAGEEDQVPHEDKQKPVYYGEERQEIKDVEAIQYGEAPHGRTKKLQNEKKTLLSKKAAPEEEKEKLKEGQKQHKKQMSELEKHHALVDPEGRVFESSSVLPNLTNLALKNPLRGNWPLSDEKAASIKGEED